MRSTRVSIDAFVTSVCVEDRLPVLLRCVAVCCSVGQCGAVWGSVAQCGAVLCSALQCVAAWRSVLQRDAGCGRVW